MVVPRSMIEVDEAHPALNKTAGEQAIGGESLELPLAAPARCLQVRLLAVNAILLQCLFSLFREVDQFGCGRLHSESQFVGRNAAIDFRVTNLGVAVAVQIA